MTDETLTQSELDEIIGKLKRALKRGEIVEHFRGDEVRILTEDSSLLINEKDYVYTILRKPIAGWVNVYPEGTLLDQYYPTKTEADRSASAKRMACVYVEETEAPGDE